MNQPSDNLIQIVSPRLSKKLTPTQYRNELAYRAIDEYLGDLSKQVNRELIQAAGDVYVVMVIIPPEDDDDQTEYSFYRVDFPDGDSILNALSLEKSVPVPVTVSQLHKRRSERYSIGEDPTCVVV